MNETEFRKHLEGRRIGKTEIESSVKAVSEFEDYLGKSNISVQHVELGAVKNYISLLIGEGRNTWDRLVAIARYCSFTGNKDCYIYFTSVLGARNVLPDIGERLASIAGEETRHRVFQGFNLPPLGSPQENYPELTQTIMDRMESELPLETCRKVLTWNYHKVPTESFGERKERFDKASSIDGYLIDEHKRFVEELRGYVKSGRVWFEQEITPEVLEFVKQNQEICTGVRQGDTIYVTKIPYDPKRYLNEKDPALKRYYACHCPLARASIRDGKSKISPMFCYCSAGFEKVHFDVIFEEPVETELLESVLKGDMRCRFANRIPKGKTK